MSAHRKPPRTRGAKPAPRPPADPPARKLKPLRLEGALIAAVLDDAGEVIGEERVADIKLFAPEFGSLPKVVADVWPKVLEAHAKTST